LALNTAVARVLYAYERFGLFYPAPRPKMSNIKDANARTAERLSEESAVLLKNKGGALPLKGSDLQSVAVIGPTVRQVMVNGGQFERARGFKDRVAINPLQVLQTLAPAGSSFTYAPGIDWIGAVVPASALSPGLIRAESDSNATRVDATIDYGASASSDLKPGVTYTWTGTLTAPSTDTYYLWLQQGFRTSRFMPFVASLSIDGAALPLFKPGVPAATYPADSILANGANSGGLTAVPHTIKITLAVPLTGVQPVTYPVPVQLTQPIGFRFAWSRLGDTINAAVAAASSAKVALVFADDNGAANAELVNSLAPNQDALIAAVAKANPNTVVVLSTGDPVLMPWLKDVKAVLEMWYPGQEGGTSTAKLLLGQANPGGGF
jgi:beta-glucosidase